MNKARTNDIDRGAERGHRRSWHWVPWEGTPTRQDLICWYSIFLMGLYYLAMWPLRPVLIGTNPVLLEILTGSEEAVISAGAFAGIGELPLILVLIGAIFGMVKFDWIIWWAGRLWGRGVVKMLGGRSRWAARFAARAGGLSPWIIWPAVALAPWTPMPAGLVYALAGWTGMRLKAFLTVHVLSSLARAGVYAGLGYAIGRPAVDVAETISSHALWVSLAILVIIAAVQLWRKRRRD